MRLKEVIRNLLEMDFEFAQIREAIWSTKSIKMHDQLVYLDPEGNIIKN